MDTASPSSDTLMRSARENKMRENHDSEKKDNSVKVGSHRRTASRGHIADNPNMKKLHIPFRLGISNTVYYHR